MLKFFDTLKPTILEIYRREGGWVGGGLGSKKFKRRRRFGKILSAKGAERAGSVAPKAHRGWETRAEGAERSCSEARRRVVSKELTLDRLVDSQ